MMREELLQYNSRLPNDWQVAKFADVATYALGRTPPRKNPEYWSQGEGIPWVTIADMTPFSSVQTTSEEVSEAASKKIFQSPPVPQGTLLDELAKLDTEARTFDCELKEIFTGLGYKRVNGHSEQ